MKPGNKKISISRKLRESISTSKEFRIRRLPTVVEEINAMAGALPDPYHWKFKTVEAFSGEISELSKKGLGTIEVNSLYWGDVIANVEAYYIMSIWRTIDICQSSFRALEEENIVPAGILARSAFEGAIQMVHDARAISPSLDSVCEIDLRNTVAQSTELENFVLGTVFSSRLSDSEEIYKSKNILTIISKIDKVAKDDQLKVYYEYLCEITHPNFLGRSNHLLGVKGGAREGEEIRIISHRNGKNSSDIRELILKTLSWSIEAQITSAWLLQKSIQGMLMAFPFVGGALK